MVTTPVTVGRCSGLVRRRAAAGLLDGVLAPLRNVHKFDPLVRLPLVLGLALLVDRARYRVRPRARAARASRARTRGDRRHGRCCPWSVARSPACAGRLAPVGAVSRRSRLLVRGGRLARARSGEPNRPGRARHRLRHLRLGPTRDEPIQALAESPWAVRNAVPLTPAGQHPDARRGRAPALAQGRGSPGLADYLRRAGVTHLVRAQRPRARRSDVPDPVLVHQALADSPGLRRVATFGPEVGGEAHLTDEDDQRVLVNGGWQDRYRAVEVFAVEGSSPTGHDGHDTGRVRGRRPGGGRGAGGPARPGRPRDPPGPADRARARRRPDQAPAGPVVLTDGLRETERNFGRVHDGDSQTLAADDPLRLSKPTRDYLPDGSADWETRAVYAGGTPRASSSMSDANAIGTVQPGRMPYAAVDGDRGTAWLSSAQSQTAPWWELSVEEPRSAAGLTDHRRRPGGDRPGPHRAHRERADPHRGRPVRDRAAHRRADVVRARRGCLRRRLGHALSLAEVDWAGVEVGRGSRLPVGARRVGCPRRGRAARGRRRPDRVRRPRRERALRARRRGRRPRSPTASPGRDRARGGRLRRPAAGSGPRPGRAPGRAPATTGPSASRPRRREPRPAGPRWPPSTATRAPPGPPSSPTCAPSCG